MEERIFADETHHLHHELPTNTDIATFIHQTPALQEVKRFMSNPPFDYVRYVLGLYSLLWFSLHLMQV